MCGGFDFHALSDLRLYEFLTSISCTRFYRFVIVFCARNLKVLRVFVILAPKVRVLLPQTLKYDA